MPRSSALLLRWVDALPDGGPQRVLLRRLVDALPQQGRGVSAVDDATRQALADVVRGYYREDMAGRTRLQAKMDMQEWAAGAARRAQRKALRQHPTMSILAELAKRTAKEKEKEKEKEKVANEKEKEAKAKEKVAKEKEKETEKLSTENNERMNNWRRSVQLPNRHLTIRYADGSWSKPVPEEHFKLLNEEGYAKQRTFKALQPQPSIVDLSERSSRSRLTSLSPMAARSARGLLRRPLTTDFHSQTHIGAVKLTLAQ